MEESTVDQYWRGDASLRIRCFDYRFLGDIAFPVPGTTRANLDEVIVCNP